MEVREKWERRERGKGCGLVVGSPMGGRFLDIEGMVDASDTLI